MHSFTHSINYVNIYHITNTNPFILLFSYLFYNYLEGLALNSSIALKRIIEKFFKNLLKVNIRNQNHNISCGERIKAYEKWTQAR
jgi:hypothetical protein